MTKKKVWIIGGAAYGEAAIFERRGWELVHGKDVALGLTPDLTVLTGGQDINPAIYGELPHPRTHYTDSRDQYEIKAIKATWHIPCAGICRGGQLLNALLGGKMYQHVENHAGGNHPLEDLETKKILKVTSLHHQMMIPGPGAEIIAIARTSTRKWRNDFVPIIPDHHVDPDIEVLYYPEAKKLCFQGHPEYNHKESEDYFFELIERKMGL